MVSMYDVLKASKDLHVDDIFAELWGRKLSSDYTIVTYTGTLPATLTGTKAGYLHGYKIYGNMEQAGTPTPENPIMPSECGERTRNLFTTDGQQTGYIRNDGTENTEGSSAEPWRISAFIPVNSGTEYTFNPNSLAGNAAKHAYYDSNKTFISVIDSGAQTFTTPTNAKYMKFSYRAISTDIMLNSGSTALPYEPYGYKLPLTSAGQSVDIYLGESPTTRRIKKLVLTGEEDWTRATNGTLYGYFVTDYYLEGNITICSHYIGDTNHTSTAIVNDKSCCFRVSNTKTIYIRDTGFNSVTAFTQYLAAQYAAGTPVTIWYVLATPETAVVNEPLMKIGTYADAIDSTQTTAQIPTTANSTTVSWAGSGLAPSEVEFEYERK